MSKNSFLEGFQKDLAKMSGIGGSSQPPRYWYSFGNHVLNKIMSGSFYNGVPQGRLTGLAGSSGSGKSFLAANLVRAAQQAGSTILIVDSENALDDEFMTKIGVDVDDGYVYASVTTIPQVTQVVSSFIKGYKAEFGTSEDAPHAFILIDSLDMLMTETEVDHYSKGNQRGDQGQRNKQLKAMLRTFVQDVKDVNIILVFTSQVYRNQDITNGEGVWIVSDAVRYSTSQIVLLSKLKLRDEQGGVGSFAGIRMKCEGFKTRFSKPFQSVQIEVPYETGMDPYSGLLEVAVGLGVVERRGARYTIKGSDKSWFSKDVADYAQEILDACEEASTDSRLMADDVDYMIDEEGEEMSARARRKQKFDEEEGE